MASNNGNGSGETTNGRQVVDRMTLRVLDWQKQCGKAPDPQAARERAINIRLRGERRRGQG